MAYELAMKVVRCYASPFAIDTVFYIIGWRGPSTGKFIRSVYAVGGGMGEANPKQNAAINARVNCL